MKRTFDFVLAIVLGLVILPIAAVVALSVRLTDNGPALHVSDRVGRKNAIFRMPKFRTMRLGTPHLATHKMTNPEQWLTRIGPFLRRSSLDEIPQLWSILKGDMSFVGPRPALFNQDDLIRERTEFGVEALRPGLTGWAQINGRDTISIDEKVALDVYYLKNQSFWLDMKILWMTAVKVLSHKDVSH